jgi:Lrp/AsnC family transcriptional regulator, leucine-responsive regulatory protein
MKPKTLQKHEAADKRGFDRLDRAILSELLQDSRRSLQDVGAKVGLSATSCWNRIKKMESEGLVTGYTVQVDASKLGYRDTVIVQVSLETHSDQAVEDFGSILASIPEVLAAYLVAGDCDYYMIIAVEDTRDYERLLREKLYKIPGIRQSKSNFVLRTLKQTSAPLL